MGKRMSIKNTRAIIDAIHSGELAAAPTVSSQYFGFQVPTTCSGVPQEVLLPETTWSDQDEFDSTLKSLAQAFVKNFDKYQVRSFLYCFCACGGLQMCWALASLHVTGALPIQAAELLMLKSLACRFSGTRSMSARHLSQHGYSSFPLQALLALASSACSINHTSNAPEQTYV